MNSPIRLLVYICFFLSGMDALIYEVAWLNRIQLIMGHTVYSLATTLAAYMSGLALGSFYVPKLKRYSKNTFQLYLIIELLVGIYGLAFYPLLKLIQIPYDVFVTQFHFSLITLSLIQFVFCTVLIIIPTFLMGTTLPLVAPFIYPDKNEVSEKLPILYGINTLGALFGSLSTGFFILPILGYSRTIQMAAAVNIGLFFMVNLFAAPSDKTDLDQKHRYHENKTPISLHSKDYWSLIVLFVSGFASMTVQVIWGRMAALSFGPSIYIFPTVTSVVLAGIVIGSFGWRKISSTPERAQQFFILLPVGTAIGLIWGNYLFAQTPHLVLILNQKVNPGFWLRSFLDWAWCLTCLLPSAACLGALFPAGTTLLTRNMTSEQSERLLGWGYALNILGLMSGAILGAFVLLPILGIEHLAEALIVLLFTLSAALAYALTGRVALAAASWALGLVNLVTVPAFDWYLMTSGYFYNRDQKALSEKMLEELGWLDPMPFFRSRKAPLLVRKDDPHATISIHEGLIDKSYKNFKVNGKVDGTNEADLRTTRLLSAFPALVKLDYQSALIIGLGTGSTAAQTLRYPEMKSVKLIEISSAMIEFSKKYFSQVDGNIWDDPRFSIELRDGRDFLEHDKNQYDLIITEPSNPWVDGVASLFTQEFFTTLGKRLSPSGVASLWFHSYGLDCEAVQSVFSAAAEAFSSVVVFKQSGDLFLLASNRVDGLALKPIPPSAVHIKQLLFEENSLTNIANEKDAYRALFEKTILYDRDSIRNVEVFAPINQDDNQFLQYRSGQTFPIGVDCQDFPGANTKDLTERFISKF